ncbi:MAG: nucleotide exchange factor GrpE [Proteobacteria bacterium]|nr:nucleotide exchange factor GrpE [Pseudomonadota bacterium]
MSDSKLEKDGAAKAPEDKGKVKKVKAAPKKGKAAELEAALKKAEEEIETLRDEKLRLLAETENFKRRITKEKEDFQKYSNEKTAAELLPVIDNLERAVEHAKEAGETGALLEGVEMTLTLFAQMLEKMGITTVDAVGETFDPQRHEAVQQIESADHEPNIVVSEFQKGYMLYERLIRPAMVVVSRPPVKQEENK